MMKIFLTIVSLCASMGLIAQNSPFNVELRVGSVISKTKLKNFEANSRVGYHFEAVVDYNLTDKFFLESAIGLSSKGFKSNTTRSSFVNINGMNVPIDLNIDVNMNAAYLGIPVMGGYRWRLNKQLTLRTLLGPYFALGVGGKTRIEQKGKINMTGVDVSYDKTEHVKTFSETPISRLDWGLAAGITLDYNRFTLNSRYEHGFDLTYKDEETSSNVWMHNRSLIFSLGYRFY